MTEVRIQLPGFSVAGLRFGPPNAPQKVLCLHGWLDSCASFTPLGYELGQRGYCVVAIDFPGHGRTDRFSGVSYSYLNYAATVVRVLNRLGWRQSKSHSSVAISPKNNQPTGRPPKTSSINTAGLPHISAPLDELLGGQLHILAHSMGAAIAVMVAGILPGEIQSLCMLDGFYSYWAESENHPDMIAAVIESEDQARAATRRVYASVDEAARARMRTVAANPGAQSISLGAARLCVMRNLRRVGSDGGGGDGGGGGSDAATGSVISSGVSGVDRTKQIQAPSGGGGGSKLSKEQRRQKSSKLVSQPPSLPPASSLMKVRANNTASSSLSSTSVSSPSFHQIWSNSSTCESTTPSQSPVLPTSLSSLSSRNPKKTINTQNADRNSTSGSGTNSNTGDGWVFSFDPHVRSGAYRLNTREVVESLYRRADSCTPTMLLLRATNGWPLSTGMHQQQLAWLTRAQFVTVAGSHHVHLDDPMSVLPHILQCFQSHLPSNENQRSWRSPLSQHIKSAAAASKL